MGETMPDFISIDWDFFTLNRELDRKVWDDEHKGFIHGALVYDWQMSENRQPGFEAALWEIRAASLKRMGFDPANATRIMLPVEEFATAISFRWPDFCATETFMADSHAWMGPIARQFAEDIVGEPLTVWNFDAHHDMGYGKNWEYDKGVLGELDCGNWAGIGLRDGWIKNFNQIYPDFRGKKEWHPERAKGFKGRVKIFTWSEFLKAVPEGDREIEGAFLCRSSSWTPPWQDGGFQKLVEEWLFVQCLDCSHSEYARHDACTPREWDWACVDEHIARIKQVEELTKENLKVQS